jgi:hypothetical protein
MEDFYERLNVGDLVFMRYFDDELGWITSKNIVYMILSVRRDNEQKTYGRDVVLFSGGGVTSETLSGYFVRCTGEELQNV